MDIETWSVICRLCLKQKSPKKLLKIWQKREKHVISDLIKKVIRLQIDEDDLLPGHVCTSCIRQMGFIQKRLKFFKQNDQLLRQVLKDKEDNKDVKTEIAEVTINESDPINVPIVDANIEHIEIKQEVYDEEDDLPLVTAFLRDLPEKEEIEQPELKTELQKRKRKATTKKVINIKDDESEEDEPQESKAESFDNFEDEEDDFRVSDQSSSDDQDSDGMDPEERRPTRKKREKRSPRAPRQKRDPSQPKPKRKFKRQYPDAPLNNDYKCYVCMTQLDNAATYAEHLFIHTDMVPYNCDRCILTKVTLNNVKALEAHFKMHARPVKCDYCDRRFNDDKAKDFHIEYTHLNKSGKTTCEFCGIVFESASRCKSHQNKVHLNKFPCPHCNKPFGAKDLLGQHIKRKHTNNIEIIQCAYCEVKLKGTDSYLTHLRGQHDKDLKYKCNICGKAYLYQSMLNTHLNQHAANPAYKPPAVRDYSKYFNEKFDEQTQQTMMECKDCLELVPKDNRKTRIHVLINHLHLFKCSICEKVFKSSILLQDHENTHTGAKPHICEMCGQNFISNAKLKIHIAKYHPEVMPFHCTKCKRAFKQERNLQSHQEKCFNK